MEKQSPLTASNNQADKLTERISIALRKSGVSKVQAQLALRYPGTEMEDEMVATIIKFYRMAAGIGVPLRAEDTGLVPNDWTVYSEELEGEINLAKLDFGYSPFPPGRSSISGNVMLKCAEEAGAIGSLGFARIAIDAEKRGEHIIPPEFHGERYIILPRTVLREHGTLYVACLRHAGMGLLLNFKSLAIGFILGATILRIRD